MRASSDIVVPAPQSRSARGARPFSLALQGGGSFGAFTWGVLDRLLEDDNVEFDALSGASAGAVNATLLATGLAEGGRQRAREKLNEFWTATSAAASFMSLARIGARMNSMARGGSTLPGWWGRWPSPMQAPFDLNPLRGLLSASIDFARLNAQSPVKLLIAATRVSTGEARIFRENELTVEHILASTCLPLIHRAVVIDGEAYWDGGFVANPPLLALIAESRASDVVLVRITPARSETVPQSRHDIERRISQIVFTTPLRAELAAVEMLRAQRSPLGSLLSRARGEQREPNLHSIDAQDYIADLAGQSAVNLDVTFLTALFDAGRRAAGDWLARAGMAAA